MVGLEIASHQKENRMPSSPLTDPYLVGASLSEPHLVVSTAVLSVYLYNIYNYISVVHRPHMITY